jgi:ribosome-associated protein YbcJ (S4-like RNA binding protein)
MGKPRPVAIRSETIELAQFLKFAGVADSGGGAKRVIVGGEVQVNGEVVTQRGRTLRMGDLVAWRDEVLVVTVVR